MWLDGCEKLSSMPYISVVRTELQALFHGDIVLFTYTSDAEETSTVAALDVIEYWLSFPWKSQKQMNWL